MKFTKQQRLTQLNLAVNKWVRWLPLVKFWTYLTNKRDLDDANSNKTQRQSRFNI